MKKRVVILVITIILVSIILVSLNTKKQENDSQDNQVKQESSNQEKIEQTEELKEITIYDIEEGYLKVPYNNMAKKNKYEWDTYLKNENGYLKYEDNNYTTKLGIDVSEHQKNIDWAKVKDAGVEFAILRLGYRGYGKAGKIVLDKDFEQNYKKATEQGIEIGVYFFSQAISSDEIKEEAEFVLSHLKGKNITYPVAFDLEKIKNDEARTDNLTEEDITKMTLQFCNIIKENNYNPSIYANAKTFTKKMKLELFNDYNKWYADYQEKPLYPYDFDIWQYTETGKMDGIEGNVDLDICFIKK